MWVRRPAALCASSRSRPINAPSAIASATSPSISSCVAIGILLLRRLPELDAVSLGVHVPGNAAVLPLFDSGIDLHALPAQLFQEPVEIPDAVIDHEGRRARLGVFRVAGGRRPDRPAGAVAGRLPPPPGANTPCR